MSSLRESRLLYITVAQVDITPAQETATVAFSVAFEAKQEVQSRLLVKAEVSRR